MSALRTIVGIVVGYLSYAAASMLLVGTVMAGAGAVRTLVTLVGLLLIGLGSGLVTTAIAGAHGRLASAIVGGLVALATLANLAMQLGAEPSWYKLGTLLLTVPAIVLASRRQAVAKKTD